MFFRKRRARRVVMNDIARMPHEVAAALMRQCAREGVGRQEFMIALSARALETSPPELRGTYARWHRAYAEGRRVKVGTYPATLLEPVDPELSDAVDAIFEQGDN